MLCNFAPEHLLRSWCNWRGENCVCARREKRQQVSGSGEGRTWVGIQKRPSWRCGATTSINVSVEGEQRNGGVLFSRFNKRPFFLYILSGRGLLTTLHSLPASLLDLQSLQTPQKVGARPGTQRCGGRCSRAPLGTWGLFVHFAQWLQGQPAQFHTSVRRTELISLNNSQLIFRDFTYF